MGSPTLRLARLALYLVWTLQPDAGCRLWALYCIGAGRAASRPFITAGAAASSAFTCRQIGAPTALRPALFASNHVSYTDITVLGSLIVGSFVAKSEVAGWPLFGWLAKLQRTVFVDRRVRSTASQRDAMTSRLAAGDALILFPEGTSGDGNRVLPFKSALFGAAEKMQQIEPIPVQPVSIAYTRLDGIPLGRLLRPFFAWYGKCRSGAASVEHDRARHPSRSSSNSIRLTLFADCGSRKALAHYCHARIAGGVAAALSGRRNRCRSRRSARPRRRPRWPALRSVEHRAICCRERPFRESAECDEAASSSRPMAAR